MQAVVLHEPKKASVESVARPDPRASDVIVKVEACGICGTDLKIFDGDYLSPYPIIPGHEFAGTIVSVGSVVPDAYMGMRVGVDPTLACGRCKFCQNAEFNHCESWGAIGDTRDGGFAEFVSVPVANVHTLPDLLSFNLGALIEPVACTAWAMERIHTKLGGSALVFGAGPMGLIIRQLLKFAGFADPVIVDRSLDRVELAKTLGVTQAVTTRDLRDLAVNYPYGFDVVVDATGNPAVLSDALTLVKKNGQVFLFGVSPQGATTVVEPFLIYHKEITISSSMAINHSYGRGLVLTEALRSELSPLISRTQPLAAYQESIVALKQGKTMKIQLIP